MKTLWVIFALSSSVCYGGGEWVPFNHPQIIMQEQIVSNTIMVQQPQPQVVYQLTPSVVFEPIVVSKRRWFCIEEKVEIVPVTRWEWQPVVIVK